MKKVDIDVLNYVEKMVEKGTNVSFEKIHNEGFETPLIQIIVKNGGIKEFIQYDYEHINSLDDLKEHLDTQISYFNSQICKSSY
ncbi:MULTISPECIES: hypothetical protein [Enterococcus]|uniref:Uncharacterized protein n=1 Tax=Enterococcus gilvus ATCC BAA-350 TaxID=1158614 RepID=R2XKU0_9ENTE|nr:MULTISPECIES: hypothetical protein [Enterococcus]EOI55524.1 hypothetical protein UKC_02732 [Enterococcus gilvus ATCC BAA-350]EOW81933.1 hypothetical protein I592_01234 [Enterococcus gilvus ATCC BAA-350]OJG41554.1 hypothetical protein RV02_GL000915 [Enterococcus gilvus]